ncbi:MAG: glycosyltransferase family 2 protein [Bacteroidota bacterium]
MNHNTLDIVLPCYNPVEDWTEQIVLSVQHIQADLPEVSLHIILVNDGSSQGVSEEDINWLERKLDRFTYINQIVNQGKGAALRAGVKSSQSDLCIFTDIDFPYTKDSFLKIYRALSEQKTDVAIGIKDDSYYQQLPSFRVKVSKFLRFLARSFLGISITDTQCGLKGFNRAGKKHFLATTISRYLADLEFIFLVDRDKSLHMKAYTIHLREGVVFSKVNLKILFREGLNFLRVLFFSLFKR